MEASICSQEENVSLFFVHPPDDAAPSSILMCAHQACEDKFRSRWLSTEECLRCTPTKEDVFICDPFEGEAFEYLVACPKSIVVGPRCILSCLHRMEPIPVLPSPLHNTAMSGLVVTTTGFPKQQKEMLQRLVQRMSGIYSNSYHQDVTHLVVKVVGSEKYKVAIEKGIPMMTEEWATAIWEAVVMGDAGEHVSATDERFLSYRCQPLHGLVVCVSQGEQSTKMELKRIIEENGGTYTTKLMMAETSVLILSTPEGRTYHYAVTWGVPCLYPEWLHQSVRLGHALEKEEYEVQVRKSSTLTNSLMCTDLPPDISMCSTILSDTEPHRTVISVDETVSLEESLERRKGDSQETYSQQQVEAADALDLQEAMRAGNFLGRSRVYLAGFNPTHTEKLRRVLAAGGASRLCQLTESVTHVVTATPSNEYLRVMQGWTTKPHVVSVRWISESIRLGHPADETQFIISIETNWDPQHPRTYRTQRSSIRVTVMDHDETHVDERLLDEQFERASRRKASIEESVQDLSLLPESQASEFPGIFSGRNFTISGHSQETKEELMEIIELNGGHIVTAPEQLGTTIHYSVITAGGSIGTLHHHSPNHKNTQLVSPSYLEDCVESQRLLPVEYYHLPLLLPADSHFPLEDSCITISTYAKYERHFLEHLVTLLGAQ